jgi:hypothetical protein
MTSQPSATPFGPFYAFRESLFEAVARDLAGPSDPFEVISDPPLTKYIVGILYPQTLDEIRAEQDDDSQDDDSEEFAPDPAIAMANVRYPSSMGLTFAIDTSTALAISVVVSAAVYVEEIVAEEEKRKRSQWRRAPIELPPVIIPLNGTTDGTKKELRPGLQLYYRIRKASNGVKPVTVVILNTNRPTEDDSTFSRDTHSFFQVGLDVKNHTNNNAAFVERPRPDLSIEDADLESYRLLYRNSRTFAVGHGCGSTWTVTDDGTRAFNVASAVVPRHELLLADNNLEIPWQGLKMRVLSGPDWDLAEKGLYDLCLGYERWIAEQKNSIPGLPQDLQKTAETHLGLCSGALNRIREGIALLRGDEECRIAFRLANSAMLQQRARTEWLKKQKPTPAPLETDDIAWRPFQIAFILLCLKGLAEPKAADRDIADLLWFPTGGGKTEAYLGLIAFTVFLRRLRSRGTAAGVTVLMRYTLRLLTIQQFERAALLISACEVIRKKHQESLGRAKLSIGLWVGQGATPNTRKVCSDALRRLSRNEVLDTENPMQLPECVWCGAPLDKNNYWQRANDKCLMITCKQDSCEFGKAGLPVYLIDEDIYDFRPELIIGTVDKFAALPWRAETASLFNLDVQECGPPELIIQDELHLIAGPLGTLTGLYETAVDALCTRDGIRPKIIASTATIRRAGGQTKALFDRLVQQFPAPAIDATDSYFSKQTSKDQKGSRLYVGLMAPGTSHSTLMIRTYAALLQAAQDIPAAQQVSDHYWTLLGYFNSLRVLGGAMLQVQDDVADRLSYLGNLLGTTPREIKDPIELTSRVPSADIPKNLKAIEVAFPAKHTVDVLVATNMISVGVDIDRLGLMVVMGQPQATAEYIQATSRVGRRYPGLVVTLFNSGRSRDRSHYENFVTYHQALYRQVESSSVTPFSPRARDRALHAILVALARLLGTKYRPNASASDIATLDQDLQRVKQIILARASKVLNGDAQELTNIEAELDGLVNRWKTEVEEHHSLLFAKYKNPRESLLVEAYEQHPDASGKFKTLRSLRDVDKTSDLYLVRI